MIDGIELLPGEKVMISIPVYRKWWQFWKPRVRWEWQPWRVE